MAKAVEPAINKTERLLDLVVALQDAVRPLTIEEIKRRLPSGAYADDPESFRRTFERDKAELRNIGLPLEVVDVPGADPPTTGYRLIPGRYELPDPGLTEAEVGALRLAAALVRISEQDDRLVDDTLVRVAGEVPADEPPVAALTEVPGLDVWSSALLERREVRFRYRRRGEVLERRLQPHRLDHRQGRWYVEGHDLDRDDRRQFRLDRVEGTPKAGDPDAFPRPEVAAPRRLHGWELGEGPATTTHVLVDASMAHVASSIVTDDAVEPRADGSVVLTLEVRNPDGLITFVMEFLEHAEVLDPPELRSVVVAHLRSFVTGSTEGVAE